MKGSLNRVDGVELQRHETRVGSVQQSCTTHKLCGDVVTVA